MSNRILIPGKHVGINHNVTFVVRDANTMKIQSIHKGHNAATNGLLTGVAHYLTGDGILNQGWHLLSSYVPKYISVGTMGLINQEQDENGYPAGIGVIEGDEETRFEDYMLQTPGYGADGYDANLNNGREWLGLGPVFANRPDPTKTINCELISPSFPRAQISYRDIIPETEAEFPETVDVIYSAMVSVGALNQFREEGKDYLFVTEAGLWSRQDWVSGGDNGLLAGYRIAPTDRVNWGMTVSSVTDDVAIQYLADQGNTNPSEEQIQNIKPQIAEENRQLLKSQIIRVNRNQVIQIIWKIQLGGIEQLVDIDNIYSEASGTLYWYKWDEIGQ